MTVSVQLHQQLEDLNKRMEEIAQDHGRPRPAAQASDASRQKVLSPSQVLYRCSLGDGLHGRVLMLCSTCWHSQVLKQTSRTMAT